MAQLRGKLPSDVWMESEDLLTSAVFGTLKYQPPSLGADLLARARPLDGALTPKLEGRLTWHFWPWWDTCEPDLVVEDARTICVIEAKLYAEFGESEIIGNQLRREWSDGSHRARESDKQLWLLAVTNHTTIPDATLRRQLAGSYADGTHVGWLSWLEVGRFLQQRRADVAGGAVDDLLELLSRMGLAPFVGFGELVAECRTLPPRGLPWVHELYLETGQPTPGPWFGAAAEVATSLRKAPVAVWQFSAPSSPDIRGFSHVIERVREWQIAGGTTWRFSPT